LAIDIYYLRVLIRKIAYSKIRCSFIQEGSCKIQPIGRATCHGTLWCTTL